MADQGTYRNHIKIGPFAGRTDPFAETGRYFQSIHSGMIEQFIIQMQDELLDKRYLVGKETSLQIAEGRQPDVFIERHIPSTDNINTWDYVALAEAIEAEAGVAVDEDNDIQALHIHSRQTGDLVTIIEIISPRNKTEPDLVAQYRERRERLIVEKGVNVVEIDLTRSNKRLLDTGLATNHAYHVAIFLPARSPRIIGMDVDYPLKRIAIPLRGEVIGLELQSAYTDAYQLATIAGHIDHEGHYTADHLPYPTLLTETQKAIAIDLARTWKEALERLENQ